MWPWTRKEPNAKLAELERRMKVLETDWDLTYEKFQRLAATLARRAKRQEEAAQEASEPTNGGAPRVTNPLAARLLGRTG